MASPPPLYSATLRFRPAFAALREVGVDVAAALARHGYSEAQLLDPESRVPRERVVELTSQLVWAAGCPHIGVLAAEHFVLRDLGVLGYLARHAATPREALGFVVRFQRLIADAADLHLRVEGDRVVLGLRLRGERPMGSVGWDYSIGSLVQMVRTLGGDAARPLSVRLPRPPPPDRAPFRRLFGQNLDFHVESGALVYALEALEVPCPEADPQLASILADHAQMRLDRLPEPSDFTEQVRAVLEAQIAQGDLNLPGVAAALGLSERTLRRRLAQRGSSFRALLDRARCDHATLSLREGKLSITEIAVRIGFADATAFTRSFRRWTGKTPSEITRSRAALAR